jgi:probable F420-dependent oxidoreductase
MALKDSTALGMSLPHRSPDPIPERVVRHVAQRAEELGFQDLWVTNNTVDVIGCFDSWTVLTWAAAVTTRIRVGVSVMVLPTYHPVHVAHVVATLDHLSGGRATLGVGLGRVEEYELFQVPADRRVRRLTESVELIRALWTGEPTTFDGEIYTARDAELGTRPVQQPGPPIWLGSFHPDALRRAARIGDGWMGAGGSSAASFAAAVPRLHEALAAEGRDPAGFPVSKRVFLSVHDRRDVARAEVERWFTEAYGNPALTDQAGVFGTPDEVGEQLEALVAAGATHLLLNPVTRYEEQLDALAEVTGIC